MVHLGQLAGHLATSALVATRFPFKGIHHLDFDPVTERSLHTDIPTDHIPIIIVVIANA